MRSVLLLLAIAGLAALPAGARDLEFYFIDVDGGQATLIVTPAGESMLVDAGWPSKWGPGANRIVAAAKAAGLGRIDYMLMTHYHLDHVGGIPELAAKFPIGTYVDHGPDTETDRMAKQLAAEYDQVVAKGKHLVVKPWDKVPLKGVTVDVVAARGETIAAKKDRQPNPACEGVKPQGPDPSENGRSIGFILSYGKFRFADFGDLTWNIENTLVCPVNQIGTVSLYVITHHGVEISNSPAMFASLKPKAAVMNNAPKKGGAPQTFDAIKAAGSIDLWQLHPSAAAPDKNAPEQFLANTETAGTCAGHWIKAVAKKDGSFTVTNERNGFSKAYRP